MKATASRKRKTRTSNFTPQFSLSASTCSSERRSAEDKKPNRVGQMLGDTGGHAAAEKIGESGALGPADDKVVDTHGRREVDNCGGGILAHRINRDYANIALVSKF